MKDAGWSTPDSCVIMGESHTDEDTLVLCIADDDTNIMTAILDRREIEGLVEYLAEWVGYPIVISTTDVGERDDWINE